MSLGRGFAVFSLAGVVAAAVLCGTARPTHANCGAGTSLVVPDQSGALDITWRYDSTNDTYSITLHNKMPVWYYVLESHPATGGACWLWLSQEHPHNLGTDRLPEAIAPHGKIELRDLHFVPGDRFGICNIGLTDAPPGYSAETAWVKAIVTMDIVGLAFLGESIGTAFAEGGALGVLKRIINSLTFGQFDKVLHLIDVLGQPNQSLSAIVSALLDVVTVSSAEKSEMMETFRAAFPGKVAGLGKGVSDLFELNTGIDLARRAIKFLPEWAAISIAYGEAPWGRLGVGVVAAPPGTNAPPDGFILQPTDDQLVGNTVSVHGVASDDCSTIQFVNATYSADNGQTWIFAGQDATSPYEINVNLASVPDGTNVLLGWDVYDANGAHVNSPHGHRRVTKNAAALAPSTNNAEFVLDVEPYIDGAVVAPGHAFVKGWRIRNTGTATWTPSYTLAFVSGTNLASVTSVPLPPLAPGQVGTVNVPMTAPSTPRLYRSTWRPRTPAGADFGSSVFALIEARAEAPGSGTCADTDKCLNMGCSTHSAPPDGTRFKTPSTGAGVFYARAGFRHSYPTSACYHLLYDDFSDLSCIANANAAPPILTDGPQACSEGSFYREEGHPAIYRMESGGLRPLCGDWTSTSFQARWGYPFQIAFLVDSAHFDDLIGAYPISAGNGIYPPGLDAPTCGDPGFQCGDHIDPDGVCYGTLHCGGCGAGAQCLAGTCVAEPVSVKIDAA